MSEQPYVVRVALFVSPLSQASLSVLMPSPHTSTQLDGDGKDTLQPGATLQPLLHPVDTSYAQVLQNHPSSWAHELSQPSLSRVLPSSHFSNPAIMLSPHCVMHVSLLVGVPPVQLKPHSMVQLAEQPSPPLVLPSSQSSPEVLFPLPHTSLQISVDDPSISTSLRNPALHKQCSWVVLPESELAFLSHETHRPAPDPVL